MVKHKKDEDSDSDWDSMSEAPPLKQTSLPIQENPVVVVPQLQETGRYVAGNGYGTDSSESSVPPSSNPPSPNPKPVLPQTRPVSGESTGLRKPALSFSAADSISEDIPAHIAKGAVSVNIVPEPLYSEVKLNSARKTKGPMVFYDNHEDNTSAPPFDFKPALKEHEIKAIPDLEPDLPPKPQRLQSYEDIEIRNSPKGLSTIETALDSTVSLPRTSRNIRLESQGCVNPGFEGSPAGSHFNKYNSTNNIASVEISEDSPAKNFKELPWPYEKIEIFPFESGNVGYYQITDKRPGIFVDRFSDRSFQVATRFWAEIFGVLGLPFVFFSAFVAQLLRFVLVGLIRPLLVGFISGLSDGFVKPLLSALYNGLWQPVCILFYNMGLSFKLIITPLAESLGLILREFVLLVSAFRLVEIRSAHETRLHNV